MSVWGDALLSWLCGVVQLVADFFRGNCNSHPVRYRLNRLCGRSLPLVVQPMRVMVPVADHQGFLGLMSAYMGPFWARSPLRSSATIPMGPDTTPLTFSSSSSPATFWLPWTAQNRGGNRGGPSRSRRTPRLARCIRPGNHRIRGATGHSLRGA